MYKAKLSNKPLADMRTIVERLDATETDCIGGTLIDNLLYWTGIHYIAFLETYINPNQSGYSVLVAESNTDDETLIDIFLQLYDDQYQASLGA